MSKIRPRQIAQEAAAPGNALVWDDVAKAWVPGAAGAALDTVAPPQVNYTASQVGTSNLAAHGDHTHKSVQFAYDYVVVT